MRRRLILSTALIALAAVIVLGVPLGAVEAARLRQDATSRLEREADAVAGAIDDRVERGAPVSPALLARLIPATHRLTVTTRRGQHVSAGPSLHGDELRARAGSRVGGFVVAEAPIGELHRRVRRAWLLIAALSGGGVLIAVLLSAVQARRLARPLEAVARRSAELGDGDFSVRVGRFGIPEVDAIAGGLDSSAGRIAELVAREREFSANVSHQLRTPLTALRLRLEEARGTEDRLARHAELDAALGEADRLEATISELLSHARRSGGPPPQAVRLAGVAHDHATRWRPLYERARRALDVVADGDVAVRTSPGTTGQVLDVLLDNALHHGSGRVRITVTADDRAGLLVVTDQGPGIPEADRDRIFARGASRSGRTGIGLHLARTLAQADGGSLVAPPGAPTRFELRLPLAGR